MKLKFKWSVCAIVCLILLTGCLKNEANVTYIRLAHTLDSNHPVHVSLEYMNEQLLRISNGTMKIILYPSGQLGSEREIVELLQMGTIGMTKVSASSLEAFVPEMKVFSLPYLFNDRAHYWQVLDSEIGKNLLSSGVDFRIKGLGYFDAGSRSFYTSNKEVLQPSDLSGLKIRVMSSQSAVDMVNTLGGAATPVSFGELYTALQQGVVDGAENNPPSFYFSKHYEVSKFYILDEHTSIPDVILIGTHRWNALNTQQQQWLEEAMSLSTEFQKELWAKSTYDSLEKVKEYGVQVISADKSVFQKEVQPLYDRLEGTPLNNLVKTIREKGDEL